MAGPRSRMAWRASAIFVAALLSAACTGAAATQPASGATATGVITASASVAAGVSASGAASHGPATAPTAPKAPTGFVLRQKANAICPDPSDGDSCIQYTFTWNSNEDASTWFVVYRGYVSILGDEECSSAEATAETLVKSKPGARSVILVEGAFVGSEMCYWVSAANDVGESAKVPGTAVPSPAAPASFTAEPIADNVACPAGGGAGDACWSWRFAWRSDADAQTKFQIYHSVRPAGQECSADTDGAELLASSDPGARSLVVTYEMTVRDDCYWIKAVNDAGESDLVPATD